MPKLTFSIENQELDSKLDQFLSKTVAELSHRTLVEKVEDVLKTKMDRLVNETSVKGRVDAIIKQQVRLYLESYLTSTRIKELSKDVLFELLKKNIDKG